MRATHVEGSKCSINVDVGLMLVEMINVKSFAYILRFILFLHMSKL